MRIKNQKRISSNCLLIANPEQPPKGFPPTALSLYWKTLKLGVKGIQLKKLAANSRYKRWQIIDLIHNGSLINSAVAVTLLVLLLVPIVRGDTVTETHPTTDTVTITVGCWNPAVCGNPAAYWTALGLNVPIVEPPTGDFLTSGALVYDWVNNPPTWFHDTPLGLPPYSTATVTAPVTQTPEPKTGVLVSLGLIVLFLTIP